MSATIPESMRLDDLLKATGYDCPVDLQGKTFEQATEGGEEITVEALTVTENGTYTAPDGKAYSPIVVKVGATSNGIRMYPWNNSEYGVSYYSFDTVPEQGTPYYVMGTTSGSSAQRYGQLKYYTEFHGTKISDTSFDNGISQSGEHQIVTLMTGNVQVGVVEDNKNVTIDVSTYVQPIQILPTENKDLMKKVTITLDNIGGGGGVSTLYAWKNISDTNTVVYSLVENPSVGDKVLYPFKNTNVTPSTRMTFEEIYQKPNETTIEVLDYNYVRDSTLDVTY